MQIDRQQVIKVIEDTETQIDMSQLSDDTVFQDAGADSLDVMNILLGIQEVIDKEIPDEDVEKITTVNEVIAYVNSNA